MRVGSWLKAAVLATGASVALAACATTPVPHGGSGLMAGHLADGRPRAYNRPYQVRGRWYTPADQPGYDRVGLASWYSYESSSGRTADGERFDARMATAAHTTLPIPSWLEVTNLDNGRSARVRLNDRGPFVQGRILDLSKAAATELGFLGRGTARVRVRYIGPADLYPGDSPMWARAEPPSRLRPPPRQVAALAAPLPFQPSAPGSSARDEVRQDVLDAPVETVAETDGPGASGPLAAPSPPPSAAGAASAFAVQAGAFADRRNAERAAERLGPAGRASVLPLTRSDGGVLYRVVVGPWREAQAAASARSRIAALGFADAKVVTP
jgi:rare lipoprotein A